MQIGPKIRMNKLLQSVWFTVVYNHLLLILTTPECVSTVNILLLAVGSYSFDVMIFSTANTTPSLHLKPIAVLKKNYIQYSSY